MMNLMFGHEPQPFADAQLCPAGSHASLFEIRVGQRAENGHRLVVHALGVCKDVVVPLGELAAVTRIAAGPLLRVLDEHPSLDAREMPYDVAEGEFAGFVGPFDVFPRNASGNAHRALANAIEVIREVIHWEPSCASPCARPSGACPAPRASE